MTDLERELRELLDEKSRESRVAPQAPRRVLRRARRRQVRVALATAVTTAAVVIGSIAGLSVILGPSPSERVIGGGESRTATIAGVTVSYPSEWTMVDLWPLANSIAVSAESSGSDGISSTSPISVPTGVPVFQLSNRDLGLGPVCTGTEAVTGDAALLYVAYNVDALTQSGVAQRTWPVQLEQGDGPCGTGYYAHWLSQSGSPYLAFASIGPDASEADKQAVFDAFDSMSFRPISLNPPAETTPGYVLDAVRPGGLVYTLEARPVPDGGLDISLVNGRRPEAGRIDLGGVGRSGDPAVQYNVSAASGVGVGSKDLGGVVFGVVSEQVAGVEARVPDVGTFQGVIVPIPSSLGSAYRAFHIEVPSAPSGSLAALDADGNVIAEEPLGPAEPTGEPTPASPADEAKSSLRNALAAALTS